MVEAAADCVGVAAVASVDAAVAKEALGTEMAPVSVTVRRIHEDAEDIEAVDDEDGDDGGCCCGGCCCCCCRGGKVLPMAEEKDEDDDDEGDESMESE